MLLRNYDSKLNIIISNKFGCCYLIYSLKPLVLMSISLLLLCSNLLRPFESLCSSVQGAPRRAKGKTSRHEVATKSILLFPLNETYKKLIFNLVGFFCAQKDAPKMHQPRFYALLRAFFKLHISHTSYPTFSFHQTAQNAWCNFSAISVKKMHEKREPPL